MQKWCKQNPPEGWGKAGSLCSATRGTFCGSLSAGREISSRPFGFKLPLLLWPGNAACLMIISCTSYCPLQVSSNDVFTGEAELLCSLGITFWRDTFPLGLPPPQMPPHPSHLRKFTKEKDQGWCFIHFLDPPQGANSGLKCVIQYYMSG